ncbi:hypothetical protein [Gordonibacter sp.]|uniref:hypothetical protein n=1 Tax=Gordonibacter sp. TaxID=1968902 RepID=UPI002FC66F64
MNGVKARMLGLAAVMMILVVGMAACAPKASDQGAKASQENDSVAVDFAWSADSDCSMCHTKEESSQVDATCLLSQHVDTTCVSCHIDEAALTASHDKATPEKAVRAVLRDTSVDEASCESCHLRSEIAAATAGLAVLTDKNGLVSNPHALPESDDHASLSCSSCHQMHVSKANLDKKAQRVCASCHHAEVYECYTCHN